jgi:DNA-binding CsgD family transcriptional regulator
MERLVSSSPSTSSSFSSSPSSATFAQALDSLDRLALHYRLGESWHKALEYSQRAGEQALALYAPQAAIAHFTRALQAAEHLSLTSPALLYRLRGQAYELSGEFDLARTDQEAALELAEVATDKMAQWQLLLDLGSLWAGREYATAGLYFERALSHVRDLDDPRKLARTLNRVGNWQVNTARPDEGMRAHQEALAILREEQDGQGVAETLDLLGMASGLYGDMINTESYLDSAIELSRKVNDKRTLISSLTSYVAFANPNLLDTTVSSHGTLEQCLRRSEEALRLSRQTGWLAGQAYAESATSSACVGYGKIGAGLVHGQEALRIATEISHQQWMASAHHNLGKAYTALYAIDLALDHLHSGLEIAEKVGSTWWIGNNAATLAIAYLLVTDLASAERVVRAWMPDAGALRARPLTLAERRLVQVSGRLALAQGDCHAALKIADRLIESAPRTQDAQPIPGALQLKGEALLALGRLEEALSALEPAREEAARRGALILLWQICASLAHLYATSKQSILQAGRTNQSRECINEIAADIEDASLRENFLHAALQLLPQDSPRESPPSSRAPRPSYPFRLTAREVQVLKLVAEGKGNRQIAQELSLSEKTVENHLNSIFTKSGTNNRSGATAFAFRHGLV